MEPEVGKRIVVGGYEQGGPGVIEKVTDEYILVKYTQETSIKKYYRKDNLNFII